MSLIQSHKVTRSQGHKPSDKKNTIIFIVGPTAVGKSAVVVALAKKINAEIISCDSMQIYKRMDIITSKPSKAQSRQVKHYLIGQVSPLKEYDAARYRNDALKKIKDILKRGKVVLFTGGTGLYVSILVDGIFNADYRDTDLRDKLYQQAEKNDSSYLHDKLKKVDPLAADKIHPNDTRRIVRALEVFKLSGKPISLLQQQRKGIAYEYDIKIFCLDMPREDLYKRIDRRVDKMFKAGLVREANRLLKLKLSRTAQAAIGLRELKGYFDGRYGLEEARALVKQNTRQYAKRQLTWFRRDKRIEWIGIDSNETAATVAKRIEEKL